MLRAISAMLLILLIGLIGCNKAASTTARSATSTSGMQVAMPADWPIPALSVPMGAVQDFIPNMYRTTPHSRDTTSVLSGPSETEYIVGFDGAFAWQDVIMHVDSIVIPLDYSVIEEKEYGGSSIPLVGTPGLHKFKRYKSLDGAIELTVDWEDVPATPLLDEHVGFAYIARANH